MCAENDALPEASVIDLVKKPKRVSKPLNLRPLCPAGGQLQGPCRKP